MAKKKQSSLTQRLLISGGLLLALLFIGVIIAAIFSADLEDTGANVAVIEIKGPILTEAGSGLFSDSVTSSSDVVTLIDKARENKNIKAVILEINSPGGSAVASDEIGQAVQLLREEKLVVAWIREAGASGAYWVASSSDHIIANRMSITGSIGVIASYMEFDEFLTEWNITYNRLVSGDRKDMTDPFTELDERDRQFMEAKLGKIHEFFIEEVATNRNLTDEQVRELADGRFFLGIEAYETGLIDGLGNQPEVLTYIEEQLEEEPVLTRYRTERGLLDELLGVKESNSRSSLLLIENVPRFH